MVRGGGPSHGPLTCFVSLFLVLPLGNTVLLQAAANGDVRMVKELIRAGSNVNVTDNGGDTGLHTAAVRGNIEIAMVMYL